MRLFSPSDKPNSASVARERLQLLLTHERASAKQPDLVAFLREEILGVIAKHLGMERHKILVKMDRGESMSILEVDLEFPTKPKMQVASGSQSVAAVAA